MSTEENKAIVRHLFEDGLNKRNVETMAECYPPGEHIEGLKFASRLFAAFPDYHIAIEDLIAEGDKVVVHWRAQGTHKGVWLGLAPTGKTFNIMGVDIEHLANGKIIAEDGAYEEGVMLRQLGVELPGD
jgi:predicted ester cyclase